MGQSSRVFGHTQKFEAYPWKFEGRGAVFAYRQGQELQKILWRMRLRQLQTLENYLQEVATDAFLHKLSTSTKLKIFLLSELFAPTL